MSLRIRLRNYDRPAASRPTSNGDAASTSNGDGAVVTQVQQPARSKSSSYSKKFRDRLKEDPVKWAKFREDEAARLRAYRKRRSEKTKEHDRETCRERQKVLFRKRKAESEASDEPQNKNKKRRILTRTQSDTLKEYNRIKKRESRAGMSAQKLTKRRAKEASYKREKRAAKKKQDERRKKKPSLVTQADGSNGTGFRTEAARRMALSRIWTKVPKDPEKFAAIVEDFIKGSRSTPRKQEALLARGLPSKRCLNFASVSESLKDKVSHLKSKRDKTSLRDRRFLVSSFLSAKRKRYLTNSFLVKEFSVPKNYLTNISKKTDETLLRVARKTRSDATCHDVVEQVQDFYKEPKISRELPCMRTVKDQAPRMVLEVSIEQAHKMWEEDHPNAVVSLSLFQKLRPDCVLLQCKTKLNQCLCEWCTNIMFKLWALNALLRSRGLSNLVIKDKYQLIELTMCKKSSKYCKHGCIYRTCSECGVSLLKEYLSLLTTNNSEQTVRWRKWDTIEYTHNNQIKRKKSQTTKIGSIQDFVDELLSEVKDLARHIFVANWQQDVFSAIRKDLPPDWALAVLDFAENFSCLSQHEIQSAHWCKEQVTVHPIVVYYHCHHEDMSHIAQEAVVIISGDLVHDHHAVHHYVGLALNYLKDCRGLQLTHLVEFSDGCSAQYKSKGPFADLSYAHNDFGIDVDRNFFGSSHGKGPSDGVSGVVKSKTRRAIISGKEVINNAEEMYNYCDKNLRLENCSKQRRSFFLVKVNDVKRDREERVVKAPLLGTRSLHAVRSVEPGVVDTRLLGCYCPGCLSADSLATCSNSTYILPWQRRALKMAVPVVTDQSSNDTGPDQPGVSLVPALDTSDLGSDILDVMKEQRDPQTEPELHPRSDSEPFDMSISELLSIIDPQEDEKDFSVEQNAYYPVYYEDPPSYYVGRVLSECDCGQVNGVHYRMKFLKYDSPTSTYRWPRTDVTECVHGHWIFHGPLEIVGHHPFTIPEIAAIGEKYQAFHHAHTVNRTYEVEG